MNPLLEADTVPLEDPFGPSGTRDNLDLLVVSQETIKGGPLVNAKRVENGVPEVEVFAVDLVASEGSDDKVSSTHIRAALHEQFEEMKKSLVEEWRSLVGEYSIGETESQEWLERVMSMYNEDTRHYHTLFHIRDMLGVARSLSAHVKDLPAILWAVWFHDVVYDAKAGDNEEKSAELFVQFADQVNLVS